MINFLKERFTSAVILRMIADVLMINTAYLIALLLRYLWLVGVEGQVSTAQEIFYNYLGHFLGTSWLLTTICLTVFYLSGFYSYGRAYRSRYKAIVIFQAVGISFLLFGVVILFLWGVISFPRSVLIPSWMFALLFLLVSRLWATLWKASIKLEHRLLPSESTVGESQIVLVIGGAGYIGSALLPKLLNQGFRVRLLDLLIYGAEPISDVRDHPNLEIVKADFRQVDQVVAAMHDVDAVIHLGAIVGDPACALDEELTIEINLMATRMIAEVAKGSGVNRFIFASTCSVYGASNATLDEHSQLNPVSLYARSKIASERVLHQLSCDRFSPVILRFGTIYGLSGRIRFDLVVNLLTAKAKRDGQITVFGGDQWRPFVHVDDAATAIFKALTAPRYLVHNEVFNVGSNEQNYTIRQIGDTIQRLVPTAQLVDSGSDTDRRNYRVNFNKIRNLLNFAPKWTVEQGIQQVIENMDIGNIVDYQDIKYSNVKFLGKEGNIEIFTKTNNWANTMLSEILPQSGNVSQALSQVRSLDTSSQPEKT